MVEIAQTPPQDAREAHKAGIELYISQNPGIIYTYDFTHQVAFPLKKRMRPTWRFPPGGSRTKQDLSKNPKFLEFLQQCNVTLSQIKQTKLSFLRPTSQRSKARYHNLDILVNWGLNVVQYWKKQDFSLISTEFIIDKETLFLLREEIDQTSLIKLAEILGTKASSKTFFYQVIREKFGQ